MTTLEDLPGEILYHIVIHLILKDVLSFAQVNRYYNHVICHSDFGHFWKHLYRRDIRDDITLDLSSDMIRQEYLHIIRETQKIKSIIGKRQKRYHLMDYAIANGYSQLLRKLMSTRYGIRLIELAEKAAYYGRKDILMDILLLEKDVDYISLIQKAAKGGHLELMIELMTNISKDIIEINLWSIFDSAISGGHLHIIDYITTYYPQFVQTPELTLEAALYGKQSSLVDMIMSNLHPEIKYSSILAAINSGMSQFLVDHLSKIHPDDRQKKLMIGMAAFSGHQNILNFLYDKYHLADISIILSSAAEGGQLHIVKKYISLCSHVTINNALNCSIRCDQAEIVQYLLVISQFRRDPYVLLKTAVFYDALDSFTIIRQYLKSDIIKSLSKLLYKSLRLSHFSIVDEIINDPLFDLSSVRQYAIKRKYLTIINYLDSIDSGNLPHHE
jgi:hypothetical protein